MHKYQEELLGVVIFSGNYICVECLVSETPTILDWIGFPGSGEWLVGVGWEPDTRIGSNFAHGYLMIVFGLEIDNIVDRLFIITLHIPSDFVGIDYLKLIAWI